MANELALQMKKDTVIERFSEITGGERQANVFIASVLLAVKDNKAIEDCTPTSVIKSALRAATLRLSVDPALKQAYLVPYSGRATLQLGWKGLYDMAMRTGKYRFINVAEIRPGYTVEFDLISGAASVERKEGSEGGWVASFELAPKWGGMGKSLFMTHSEIQSHKEKYAKGHNRSDSAWNTSLLQMERKTVLRNLLQTW
jgi:recombination protein RecT